MHRAPSVSYPVGRLRFPFWIAAGVWGTSGLLLALWGWTVDPSAAVAAGAVLIWLVCGTAAAWGWQRAERGVLHWDGSAWHWEPDAGSVIRPDAAPDSVARASRLAAADALALGVPGFPVCALDLQSHLWVRWTDSARTGRSAPAVRWLWLRRADDAERWPALRRALFASAL